MDQTPAIPELGPGHFDFTNPDRLFPATVAESRLHLWNPGDPVAHLGTRILIGVATWSGYDMRLLDVIDEALEKTNGNTPLVEVFNAGSLTSQEAFQDYIPGIGEVVQVPVVGIWHDGRIVERASGYAARDLVARMSGSSSDGVVQDIDAWRRHRYESQFQRH
jgi:hypothetical protein